MISILIPYMNGLEVTAKCIESIKSSNFNLDNIQICCVSSMCTDGTDDYINSIDWCKVSLKSFVERKLPAEAYNICAENAIGEYYIATNNDMEFQPDTVSKMFSTLRSSPDFISLVCCCLDCKRGNNLEVLNHRIHFNFPFIIRANDWKSIGGFHKYFYSGFNCEELVISRQLDMLGKISLIDLSTYAIHNTSYTTTNSPISVNPNKDMFNKWMYENNNYCYDNRLSEKIRHLINSNRNILNGLNIQTNFIDMVPV